MADKRTTEVTVRGTRFTVEFEYFPFRPGSKEGPIKLEPDEEESVEIQSVVSSDELCLVLSEDVMDEIARLIFVEIKETREDADYNEYTERKHLDE